MAWRTFSGVLLIGCCALCAGCAPSQDADVKEAVATGSGGQDAGPENTGTQESVPREPVEPSVEYFALDAPEGMSRAVAVEGFPLVYTRQLLPLDAEGNLVGEGAAEKQIEQVLANLETVLTAAGSGLGKLVRLNVCIDSPTTTDLLREQLGKRLDASVRPAISSVVSPLSHPKALIGVDAVAIAEANGDSVALQRCESVAGDQACADVSILPRGGMVYLSGQTDKSALAEATVKSLTTLLEIVDQLELERSQVAQLKVFLQPATATGEVLREVKKLFAGQRVPPVVFVEWIASAPVEIEMVVHLPLSENKPAETLRFYTPPGVKASPTFSRVAIVDTERQIFISGLSARTAGDGEAQVRDVFAQLKQILSATGSDFRHLAKATYYVSDEGEDEGASKKLNELRPEFYDPKRPPAASKAAVQGVGRSDRTLSIDMIAVGSGESS